jgi:hypothetical protein
MVTDVEPWCDPSQYTIVTTLMTYALGPWGVEGSTELKYDNCGRLPLRIKLRILFDLLLQGLIVYSCNAKSPETHERHLDITSWWKNGVTSLAGQWGQSKHILSHRYWCSLLRYCYVITGEWRICTKHRVFIWNFDSRLTIQKMKMLPYNDKRNHVLNIQLTYIIIFFRILPQSSFLWHLGIIWQNWHI